jgi:hypothetical protein
MTTGTPKCMSGLLLICTFDSRLGDESMITPFNFIIDVQKCSVVELLVLLLLANKWLVSKGILRSISSTAREY